MIKLTDYNDIVPCEKNVFPANNGPIRSITRYQAMSSYFYVKPCRQGQTDSKHMCVWDWSLSKQKHSTYWASLGTGIANEKDCRLTRRNL